MNRSAHLGDEELSEALARAQQAHVDRCPDCARRRSAVLAVRQAVRGLPRTADPPAATMAVLEAPRAAPHRPWWRRQRGGVSLAAAAAALLLVGLGVGWSARPTQRAPMREALAQEIALDHLHYEHKREAAEISGSTDQIGDYFEQTLRRRPHLAPLEATSVVGAKRCRIGGEWSALIWLERAGRWLSLFSMPHDAVASRGCTRAAGVSVCGVPDPRGGARVLAGSLPDAELLRLLDESME